jgi:hypothetical protein
MAGDYVAQWTIAKATVIEIRHGGRIGQSVVSDAEVVQSDGDVLVDRRVELLDRLLQAETQSID